MGNIFSEVKRTHYTKPLKCSAFGDFVVRPAGLCRLRLLTSSAGLHSCGRGRIEP